MKMTVGLVGAVARGAALKTFREGEAAGLICTEGAAAGLFAVIVLMMLYWSVRTPIAGITSALLLVQFARWGVLIGYSTSEFYRGFWSALNYWFHPYEAFESEEDPPDNEGLLGMKVGTSRFLINAEGYLVLLTMGLAVFLGYFYSCKSEQGKNRAYSILN